VVSHGGGHGAFDEQHVAAFTFTPSQTRTPPVASDVSHTGVIYNRRRRPGITTDSFAFDTKSMNPKCANSFLVFHFSVVGSVR